jgi:hypothetical protein
MLVSVTVKLGAVEETTIFHQWYWRSPTLSVLLSIT